MHIDMNRLYVFWVVARSDTLAQAAERLHVSPSAVSHALRKLQEELGIELMVPVGRILELTPSGRRLFESCNRAFGEFENIDRILHEPSGEDLVLGCTVEFGTQVLVRKLAPFMRAHPQLRLHFHFHNELAGPLMSREVDLVVDCQEHLHPHLEVIALFRERYNVVATPELIQKHALVFPQDLARVELLSLDPRGEWWERFLSVLPREQRPLIANWRTFTHLRGMIQAACEGIGVALVPRYAITPELAIGRLAVLFANILIPDDHFRVYQFTTLARRPKNLLLTQYLKMLSLPEYADALTPPEG